jgi:hypothetical protein
MDERQFTYLTYPLGVGVNVGAAVGVSVAAGCGVGVSVAVASGMAVGVFVAAGVGVNVGVSSGRGAVAVQVGVEASFPVKKGWPLPSASDPLSKA